MPKLKLLMVLVVLAVSGCAATYPNKYGAFVELHNKDVSALVNDTVAQIAAVTPPAKNTLHLCTENAQDQLFKQFVDELRKAGFGFDNDEDAGCFRYIFDHLADENLYRLTVNFNNHQLNRAYTLDGSTFVPAGRWSFRYGN